MSFLPLKCGKSDDKLVCLANHQRLHEKIWNKFNILVIIVK